MLALFSDVVLVVSTYFVTNLLRKRELAALS